MIFMIFMIKWYRWIYERLEYNMMIDNNRDDDMILSLYLIKIDDI